MHISIKPETVFEFAGFPITNSLITSTALLGLFAIFCLFLTFSTNKSSNIAFFSRFVISGLYKLFEPILGKFTNSAFPFIASFFLFILLSNWMGLLPGIGSIVITPPDDSHADTSYTDEQAYPLSDNSNGIEAANEEVAKEEKHGAIPVFRGATADLNVTLGLALVAFTLIQFFGLKALGFGYIQKFLNFSNPINFFIGVLEIVSELSKIISFAFRLFGNIFAGEVLLVVIAFLVPILASFPFLLLEIFVGFIQAVVFAMLTAVFISSAVQSHESH